MPCPRKASERRGGEESEKGKEEEERRAPELRPRNAGKGGWQRASAGGVGTALTSVRKLRHTLDACARPTEARGPELPLRLAQRTLACLRDLSGRKCGCGRCAAEVRPRALPQASRVAGAPTPAASVGAAAAPVLASLSETKKTRDPKEPPMKSEQTFQHVKKAPRLLWKKSVPGPSLLIT